MNIIDFIRSDSTEVSNKEVETFSEIENDQPFENPYIVSNVLFYVQKKALKVLFYVQNLNCNILFYRQIEGLNFLFYVQKWAVNVLFYVLK